MRIRFGFNKSNKNELTKTVVYSEGGDREGSLVDGTSIINPVILCKGGPRAFTNVNYFHVPDFGRYYYITKIESVRTGIVRVSGHVDVLSSFASQIRTNNCIIERTEKRYNRFLNDGSFRVYQNREVINKYEFPEANKFSTFDFVLALAGS